MFLIKQRCSSRLKAHAPLLYLYDVCGIRGAWTNALRHRLQHLGLTRPLRGRGRTGFIICDAPTDSPSQGWDRSRHRHVLIPRPWPPRRLARPHQLVPTGSPVTPSLRPCNSPQREEARDHLVQTHRARGAAMARRDCLRLGRGGLGCWLLQDAFVDSPAPRAHVPLGQQVEGSGPSQTTDPQNHSLGVCAWGT